MTTSPSKPVANKSQPQRVVESIQARILNGELKVGDRIPPEPSLMEEFSVSRTVVREAMSSLQASGFVKTRHGIGTFVLERTGSASLLSAPPQELHVKQTLAMLELRISLESEAAHLAALRRTDAHLAVMREALLSYRSNWQAGKSTVEDDYRFHAEIAAATDNQYFLEVLGNLGNATLRSHSHEGIEQTKAKVTTGQFGEALPILSDGKETAQREHEAIFDAIARQDAASAKAAMFMHLSNSRERLRRKIEPA
jgi:GntR family transcriptional repressor for pyruvate dehydrogenase complex